MGGDTEESLRLESEQYDQVSSSDFDRQGKLNRKVWLQEQRNSKLVGEIEGMRKGYQEEMQVEIMTASGLRDRIGKLEQKLRKGKQELADWEVVQRRLSRELESARTHFAAEEGRLKTEWTDMKEALAKEKKGVTILRGEVTALTGDRQAALEELKRLRDTKQAVLIR
jgi:small-conductance mechanosensitive channel